VKVWFKALPDDEGIDRIVIEKVPRFKESGISGDEWRTSAKVSCYRKGALVFEVTRGDLRAAVACLPRDLLEMPDHSSVALWGYDGSVCMQPGCSDPAVVKKTIRQEFSANGEGPLPISGGDRHARAFCAKHATRGDASREDSDSNYINGPLPGDAA
jgi:hypothetical protein